MTASYEEKAANLLELMKEYTREDAAVAFSGGADSALVLKLAVLSGGKQGSRIHAITADTELHPAADTAFAAEAAREAGAIHHVLSVRELEQAGIRDNPKDRCYRCKKYLFGQIKSLAGELGAGIILEGTNADDLLAYRPGLKAVRELQVKSPLLEAGLTKAEVRKLARQYGIISADRPSAPCLATRFPYGDRLTEEKLNLVEQGEAFLKALGLYNVRLRIHGSIARIETDPESMEIFLEKREEIVSRLKKLGYAYLTLDLEGFRSGSMDEGKTS